MDLSFLSKSLCFLGAMLHSVSVGWILTSNSHVCVSTCILSRSYKKEEKKKTCTSSSDLPMRVIVAFFYIVEAYMFHQVCISLSILTFLLDENFALDVHLLSRLFLLFVCFIGVYDTYENYYFLALQFLRVWSPKWNHDFNCHRAENKPMFSPQHLFQNKIC